MQLHVLCLGPLFTNCCIIGNDDGQAYIVDPANDAERIIDVIDTAGLTPRAVLLTHAHFDHIAALPAVASRYDLPVWLDPDDLPVYESPMNCFPPEIPAVEHLPDTVSELDIAIDSGCRAGNCGTCKTAIVSGEVTYLHEPGEMPEAGSCLTCIAVPKGDVTLDA